MPEAFRGIGVRIEDDVLVTADGCENLSGMLPRTVPGIEAWMASLNGEPTETPAETPSGTSGPASDRNG